MSVQYVDTPQVRIAYETFGQASESPLVLISGLGTQMVGWQDALCERLAASGFFVIRFDNRDIGLSTHFTQVGTPGLPQYLAGEPVTESAYRLEDMADDVAALLDGLGIAQAHILGASMGGMIAQTFAIRHPERTLSLTSFYSTPSPKIGGPTQAAWAAMMTPPGKTEEAAVQRSVELYRVIGSPGYEFDEAGIRARSGESFRRANDPDGVTRQLIAIQASGDRTDALHSLNIPTLVVHGEADPLVQLPGGKATAAAIPGAKFLTYPGMGHDMPEALWDEFITEISAIARADA